MELTYQKTRKKQKYICDIKFYSKLYFSPSSIVHSIIELSSIIKAGETGLLITNAICPPQCKSDAIKKGVIVLDIANLLYFIQPNDDLYRFDLICKIKNDVNDDFFSTLNTYFNTRYIVFDFKNYTEEITQKEIYTTEKYLYDKALRKVAIIISRKGIDKNALQAIKGSIRKQGKVILSLTDDDMLKMIQMHNNGNNPTDYLSIKLDKLLIELEK